MIKLEHPEQLQAQLEKGIGKPGTFYEVYPPHLRLRAPVCGLASYALSIAMRGEDNEVSMVHSRPDFAFDPGFTHVFTVVHGDEGDTIVDPTYSSVLDLAGLTAARVMGGDEDIYPEQKIAVFPKDHAYLISSELTQVALHSLVIQAMNEDPYARPPSMKGMSAVKIRESFESIWDPKNWEPYHPEPGLRHEGRELAKYITSDSVRFIA